MKRARQSDNELARKLGVSRARAQQLRAAQGLAPANHWAAPKRIDWDRVLLEERQHEKKNTSQLARELGVTRNAVVQALGARGLKPAKVPPPSRAKADWDDVIIRQRLHETRGPEYIAERWGCSVTTVKRRIWERKAALQD